MMRFLFLCLLLRTAIVRGGFEVCPTINGDWCCDGCEFTNASLFSRPFPTATEDEYGSGSEEIDDEDLAPEVAQTAKPNFRMVTLLADADKSTGGDRAQSEFITIVIVVAVSVVALSIAAIVAVMLVRRRMHNRQQGIYSVPAEQGQKGAV